MEPENLAFRRYLKDHHISDEPLHILAQEFAPRFDCKSCANCCRETRVEVNETEIQAIAADLHMSVERVRNEYTEHDREHVTTLLRQVDDACVFLHQNLCLVYDARPTACRKFPGVLANENSLNRRMESVCRQAEFCPIVDSALEAFKHQTGYRTPI